MKSRLMILSGILAALISVPAYAQMYNQQTVYTDCATTEGSPTIHAWGYTYAPSGNNLQHTYNTHTKIILPSGLSAENWASGSGYSSAVANVYITVPINDLINGFEGEVNLTSNHTAYCPGAGTNFLNNVSRFWPISFKITTTRTTSEGVAGSSRICNTVPACSYGSPTCGYSNITVFLDISEACCVYGRSYFVVTSFCTGLGLYHCVAGPGICT